MFFPASKVLWFLATPSNLLLVLLVLSVVLMFSGFWRVGRRCTLILVAVLAVAGMLPLGNLLLQPLEQRFPQWSPGVSAPTGIVVLGGAGIQDISMQRGQAALNEAAERVTEGAVLARRFPRAKLVFTGGDGGILTSEGSEADDAAALFVKLGVPNSQIVLEKHSRNTFENARNLSAMLQVKPGETWLLVTSAAHMPRAMGCFRKAGLNMTAYPVDYRTRTGTGHYWPSASLAEGLRRFDNAVREWTGLLSYGLLGYTNSVWPAPEPGAQ